MKFSIYLNRRVFVMFGVSKGDLYIFYCTYKTRAAMSSPRARYNLLKDIFVVA